MSICEVQKNYPLKKRPIQIVDSQDEPEDLSFNKRIKVPNEEYEFQPSTPESIKKDDTDSNDSHIQIDDDDEPIDVSTTKEPLKGITPLPVPHVIYSPKAKHPELMPWTLSVPPFPYLGRDYPYPFVRRFAVNHMKINATKSDDIRRECWTPNKAKAYHLLQPSSMDINRLRQFTYGLNNNFIKPTTDGTYPYPLPHYYGDQRNGVSASVTATPFQLPLSPASSTASYYSLDSPRRSESPVSSTSSQTENFSLSYPMTVLRDISTSPSSKNITKNYRSDGREKADRSISSHYKCPDCGKSYSTYSGMSKHQQFHCPAAEGNQAKKSFNCKNCEKVYTSLGALKMHIRTHTLPCKCDICGKAFSRPWLLQGHIRTHTGEKPFNCQFCHRAFADRSNLRAHLQTHSDVKKYSCKSCSKTFSRMSLLVKHAEGGCPGLQLNPMFGRKEGVPAY